jgi:hypothetical protein
MKHDMVTAKSDVRIPNMRLTVMGVEIMKLQMEETASDLVRSATDKTPDDTWPTEALLDFATQALGNGDKHEQRLHALARKSVVSKVRAGQAFTILQQRFTATGKWCEFQKNNDLPRTKVWEVIKVYEKAVELGHGEEVVANYGTWTEVMVAYGIAKPRRVDEDQPDIITVQPSDDANDELAVEDDGVQNEEDGWEDEELEDDSDEDVVVGDPDAEPQEIADAEIPPVTDNQIGAANSFIAIVGGLECAARALITTSIKSGDKDAVKGALAEVVRAARAILTPAEIGEIMIVNNAKGFKWVSV